MTTVSLSAVEQPTKQLGTTLDQTQCRISSAFKTTGREKKASWGNRFLKDVNDLNYDIKYNLIKGKQQFKPKPKKGLHLRRNTMSAMSRRSTMSRPGTSPAKTSNYQKNANRQQLIKMNKIKDAEQYAIRERQCYSTLQTSGLCKYEYEKTIKGRLTYKTNHHMHFQYQTERNKNINPVWYDREDELNLQKMMQTITHSKVQRCHPFSSYTQRKVFVPREELDKFYNTKKEKLRCSPQKIKQTVKISKISGRKDNKQKISARLYYDEYKSRKSIEPKIQAHRISNSERILKIKPQVIYDNRGCYR